MNFLISGDSRDSSCFTNNIISHSFWNCGGSHVTASCTQCVLMKQISTCDTHDLTDQLHSLVYVVFRTGVYDCSRREEIMLLQPVRRSIPDPTKQHRSTDDKHQSRSMVTIDDEGQLRRDSVSSYGALTVKSLRVQDKAGSLGRMFPTKLHSFVTNQNMRLHN